MASKFLYLVLLALALFTTSCLKHKPLPNYPISGRKWQQVELRIYHKTYHGLIFNDTTYQSPAFDSLDFVQFFNDGSLKIASHVYYPLDASGALSDPPGQYFSYNHRFIKLSSLYLIDYSAFHADTVYFNGRDSLRIHSALNNNLYYNEVDAYYTR